MTRYAFLLLLCVGATTSAAQVPVALPDSPAGRLYREWLRVANSGDRDAIRAYVTRYEAQDPADTADVRETVETILRIHRTEGELRVTNVFAAEPEALTLGLAGANGRRLRMRYEVGRQGDGWRVLNIGIRPDEPPDPRDSVPPGLDRAGEARWLGERLTAKAAAGAFSGAVLVAPGGTVSFRGAYGIADRRTGAQNTPDTRFTLASMGKMFTAVAIAQLYEQGKVHLDSSLARYVPDYPNREFARQATVRMLLSHTSGLGSYWNPLFEQRRATLTTVESHLPLFAGDAIPFTPGSRFRYSNAGYQVLGLVIERVTGQSYHDFVRDHIFAPAGMTATGYYGADGETSGGAVGYSRQGPNGEWRDNLTAREVRGGPAGGGYSTVEDLLRFAQALLGGKIIQRKTLHLWTRVHSDRRGERDGYGFGFVVEYIAGRKWFGHSGGAPGMATNIWIDPAGGSVGVVLANLDPPAVGPVMTMVKELVTK
jgi:CubicO group peptidase (beta-lactamase class C family)